MIQVRQDTEASSTFWKRFSLLSYCTEPSPFFFFQRSTLDFQLKNPAPGQASLSFTCWNQIVAMQAPTPVLVLVRLASPQDAKMQCTVPHPLSAADRVPF